MTWPIIQQVQINFENDCKKMRSVNGVFDVIEIIIPYTLSVCFIYRVATTIIDYNELWFTI
jgi:hypothetical protein